MDEEGAHAGHSDELERSEAEVPRCPAYAVDTNAAATETTTAGATVVTPQQQTQRETFFPFSDLPEELALQVLLHISLADVWAVALASRRLHALCSENLLWGTLAERLWGKADEDLARQQQQAVTANASAAAGESEEGSDRGESAVKTEHQPFSLVGHAKANKQKVALRTIDWKAYTRERLTFERPGALQWIPRRTKRGCHPKARYSHTATTVGSKIYFIGGEYIEPFRLNDIYCFDADTSVWTKIEPKEQNAEVPFLARHTAVAIGHNILVYGGYDGISNFYDIFVFDTVENVWWQPLVSGDVPPPRSNHTAATVGNKMYIFGGLRHKGEEKDQQYTVLGDMYVLDTETWSWRQLGSICHAPDDYLSIYPEHMRPFIANSSSSPPSTSLQSSSDTNTCPLSSSPPFSLPLCSSSSSSSSSSPCGSSYSSSALSLPDIPPLSTSVYSSTLTEDLFPWHYPAPRIGHKMVGVGHRLFLFGGGVWSFQQPRWIQQLHDFWVFDTEGGHWYQPDVKGEVPRLCYPFFFVLGNYLFVAGGQTTGSNVELSEDFYYLDTISLVWHKFTHRLKLENKFIRDMGAVSVVIHDLSDLLLQRQNFVSSYEPSAGTKEKELEENEPRTVEEEEEEEEDAELALLTSRFDEQDAGRLTALVIEEEEAEEEAEEEEEDEEEDLGNGAEIPERNEHCVASAFFYGGYCGGSVAYSDDFYELRFLDVLFHHHLSGCNTAYTNNASHCS